MKPRYLLSMVPGMFALIACGSESSGSVENGQTGTDAGADAEAAVPAVSRLSCGDVPVLSWDYIARPAPEACKATIEASCCTQAEACAADATCKARMECLAACRNDFLCRTNCTPETNTITDDYQRCVEEPHPECLDLSCVGTAPPPAPAEPQQVKVRAIGFIDPAPIGGTSVKVCALEDLDCAHPLDAGTTTGDEFVDLAFPPGQNYMELTAPGHTPTLAFFRRFDPHMPNALSITVPETSATAAVAALIGAPDDPTRGGITLEVRSCVRSPVPGMQFASSAADANTVQVYDQASLPSAAATMTDGAILAGGFGNHPAGRTTLTATDVATGARYGSVDVIVRAGYATFVAITPSP